VLSSGVYAMALTYHVLLTSVNTMPEHCVSNVKDSSFDCVLQGNNVPMMLVI